MNRRDFMRKLLGGGAAALVGVAVPSSLGPEEIALLEERVDLDFRDGTLYVHNLTREEITVWGSSCGTLDLGTDNFRITQISVYTSMGHEWVWEAP